MNQTSPLMRSTHIKRVAMLPGLGWELQANGLWKNPRSHRLYDEFGAINIECLRETFQKDWRKGYDLRHPRSTRRTLQSDEQTKT